MIYEAKTGTVLGKDWQVWIREEENPEIFWAIFAFQSLFALFLLIFGIYVQFFKV